MTIQHIIRGVLSGICILFLCLAWLEVGVIQFGVKRTLWIWAMTFLMFFVYKLTF